MGIRGHGCLPACSDEHLELFVSQLIDRHDFLELLGVTLQVLKEVRDSHVLHHSQALEALHILVGHLQINIFKQTVLRNSSKQKNLVKIVG